MKYLFAVLLLSLSACDGKEYYQVEKQACTSVPTGRVDSVMVMGACLSKGKNGICYMYQQIPVESTEFAVSCHFTEWK